MHLYIRIDNLIIENILIRLILGRYYVVPDKILVEFRKYPEN